MFVAKLYIDNNNGYFDQLQDALGAITIRVIIT
jgi:hypothetical protein